MKNFTLFFVFALFSTAAFAQQLLSDPGFEETVDLADTLQWNTTGSGVINTEFVYEGAKAGELPAVTGDGSAPNLISYFEVTAGTTYDVEFWARDFSDASSKAVTFSIRDVEGAYQLLATDTLETEIGQLANSCNNCNPPAAPNHTFKVLKDHVDTAWKRGFFSFTSTESGVFLIRIQKGKNDTESTFIDQVTVSVAGGVGTAVEDLDALNFSFYPNPTSDYISLASDATIEHVALYNLVGQRVLTQSFDTNQAQLEVAQLPKGAYLMQVTTGGEMGTYKIVKK